MISLFLSFFFSLSLNAATIMIILRMVENVDAWKASPSFRLRVNASETEEKTKQKERKNAQARKKCVSYNQKPL